MRSGNTIYPCKRRPTNLDRIGNPRKSFTQYFGQFQRGLWGSNWTLAFMRSTPLPSTCISRSFSERGSAGAREISNCIPYSAYAATSPRLSIFPTANCTRQYFGYSCFRAGTFYIMHRDYPDFARLNAIHLSDGFLCDPRQTGFAISKTKISCNQLSLFNFQWNCGEPAAHFVH